MRSARSACCLLVPLVLLPACTSGPPPTAGPLAPSRNPDVLLALLASPSTPDASRQAADQRLAAATSKTNPARLAVLEQILYAPGHSDAMREYALDQLAAADPARCANALILYLPRMTGDVLAHACAAAKALGDPRLLDPLARSLARMSGPPREPGNANDRPELPAITALSGKPAVDALYDLLATSTDTSVQIAALDSLEVLLPADQVVKRVAQLQPGQDASAAFVTDEQWWASAFGTLPLGENECRWVQTLHRPENAGMVERAIAAHHELAGQTDYVAAPRFVAVLAAMDADGGALKMTRQQLLDALAAALAAVPHAHRAPAYAGAPDDVPDTLAANAAKLSRGDLLTLRLLLATLPAALPALYQQGIDDLSDTNTEHGGLLKISEGSPPALTPTIYPPTLTDGNFTYLTPESLIRDTPLGIAQYHFHFQQIHNEDRAGPGAGDLSYIRSAACNGVVITSVDTRQVNVDFYTSAGAVVDIGTYTVK
ncbi:MAG TPA: hypothetical protein VHQ47_08595 [Phycisphaerae bacterium]|nr:hypothetical protein [Phycisphaerae bacterium]